MSGAYNRAADWFTPFSPFCIDRPRLSLLANLSARFNDSKNLIAYLI